MVLPSPNQVDDEQLYLCKSSARLLRHSFSEADGRPRTHAHLAFIKAFYKYSIQYVIYKCFETVIQKFRNKSVSVIRSDENLSLQLMNLPY